MNGRVLPPGVAEVESHRYSTKEYGLFHAYDGQRPIDQKALDMLKKSAINNRFEEPVKINENYDVLDGQHRLEVCRQNEWPVEFEFVNPKVQNEYCRLVNQAQHKWRTRDHLNFYRQQKESQSADYILTGMELFDIEAGLVLMAAGKNRGLISFNKPGIAQIWQDDRNDEIFTEADYNESVRILDKCDEIYRTMSQTARVSKRHCYQSVIKVCRTEGFSYERLLKQIEENSSKIPSGMGNDQLILETFAKLYNYNKRPPYMDVYLGPANATVVDFDSKVNRFR